MTVRTIALVGHSAAGKSSCLQYLNVERNADMDIALGTRQSPSLDEALAWMTDSSRPPIIAVSNHEEMLKALHAAKVCGSHAELLSQIRFVYLHKPKDRLARHLSKPSAGGSFRPKACQDYTLAEYRRFHKMFTDLADDVFDCSSNSVQETAEQVLELTKQVKEQQGS